jgi:cytochrome c-type biogenesis protein CcmH
MKPLLWILLSIALLWSALPAFGQADAPPQDPPIGAAQISDDAVNTVAEKLYCPVCENIPLDSCGTAACVDWKNDIRLQLAAGRSESQIIDDFVQRYGERVVGTPQDPVLRALSLLTPWVLAVLITIFAVYTLLKLWRSRSAATSVAVAGGSQNGANLGRDDDYHIRIENDLSGFR